MKTEEAIELIGMEQDDYIKADYWKKIDEVKDLLKRGEKFEKMWEEIKILMSTKGTKEALHMNFEDFIDTMITVEQKHFPSKLDKKNKV